MIAHPRAPELPLYIIQHNADPPLQLLQPRLHRQIEIADHHAAFSVSADWELPQPAGWLEASQAPAAAVIEP
jgi:hypothetical protein